MSFLKKDMNLKLIFLMLVLVVAITGFSILYQTKLENISTEYKNKTEHLEKVTAKAISEEGRADEVSQLKEKLKGDKETLEIWYNQLKNGNQELKRDKDILQKELQDTKSQLLDAIEKFNLLQSRFNQVEESLIKANDKISRLSARVRKLCSELESAGRSDEEC